MLWRRNFVSYAAVGIVSLYLLPTLVSFLLQAGIGPFFLPLDYVAVWVFGSASAWILAPPATRGLWVLRYGLAVLASWLLVVFVMVLFPDIDPDLVRMRKRPSLIADLAGPILFAAFLWPMWLVIARPYLKSK